MNMALVFVQIARHLYQVMTPKVTILTKEKIHIWAPGERLEDLKVCSGAPRSTKPLVKVRYYGGKIRLRKS